jgi:hypothetical protein
VKYLFGYIIPFKEELKVREYNVFKSYYCGLCKTIKREYGYPARMGLNYDLTFLSLLLSSLDENQSKVVPEVCIANPLKKRPVVCKDKYLSYSAGMNVMLVYFKLIDDLKDQHSISALVGLLLYFFPYKKAGRIYKKKHDSIKERLDELAKLEKRGCNVIDEAADTFANLMADIFECKEVISNDRTSRVLRWLGYNVGRWIYIFDAFHDIDKDIRQKNYNPLLSQYRYYNKETSEAFVLRVKGQVEDTLTFTLDNVAKSFELLDIKHNRSILENIVYMGTRDKMDQIFKKGVTNDEKSV